MDGAMEEVSYEVLLDLLRQERRSNRPVDLNDGFWASTRQYMETLESELRSAQSEDMFGRRVLMLYEQAKNAKESLESFWVLRERKILLLAASHSPTPAGLDALTRKERLLFDRLRMTLEQGREDVLSMLGAREPVKRAASAAVGSGTSRRPDAPTPTPVAPSPAPAPKPQAPPAPPAPAEQPAEAQPDPKPEPAPAPSPPAAKPRSEDVPDWLDEPDEAEAPEPVDRDVDTAVDHTQFDAPPRPPSPPPASPEPAASAPAAGGSELEVKVTVPSDTPGQPSVIIRAETRIPTFVGPDLETYSLEEGDLARVPKRIADMMVRRGKATIVQG